MKKAVRVNSPAAPICADAVFPRVVPAAPPLARLRVGETLTAATAPGLRAMLRSYADQGCVRLLVDLEAVAAIDAAGLAALLDGRNLLEGRPGGALLLRLNPAMRGALQRSGTIDAFRVWSEPHA